MGGASGHLNAFPAWGAGPAPARALLVRASERAGAMGMTDSADALDVRRCLGGDGDAFRRIVDRHQAMVARLLWRFSRDPSAHEELVQDAFIEAFESLRSYRGDGSLAHWLACIATRVGYRHWRRSRRERERWPLAATDLDALPEAPTEDPEDHAKAADLLYRLLATLPPRDRLVLTLRYVEGHSVERTAELTGWSGTMVKVQSLRARAKLRAAYERAEREVRHEG